MPNAPSAEDSQAQETSEVDLLPDMDLLDTITAGATPQDPEHFHRRR
ncbi:hypothetical protein [Lolliginicoccus levis]|nr:hypothetical protein [Lolliginicoccus levis]